MPPQPMLSATQRAFLDEARRAVLATLSLDGRPRLVPICFSLDPAAPVLYTPLDEKPKRSDDPLALARVRDIAADPAVSLLFDRWDEDWSRLAWLRADGQAALVTPAEDRGAHAAAVAALRARYPQYKTHRLEARPLIRITIERVTDWGAIAAMEASDR
jgi:PPOX class probable F420-dependent enzyme